MQVDKLSRNLLTRAKIMKMSCYINTYVRRQTYTEMYVVCLTQIGNLISMQIELNLGELNRGYEANQNVGLIFAKLYNRYRWECFPFSWQWKFIFLAFCICYFYIRHISCSKPKVIVHSVGTVKVAMEWHFEK